MNRTFLTRTAIVTALAIGLGACSGGLFGGGDGKKVTPTAGVLQPQVALHQVLAALHRLAGDHALAVDRRPWDIHSAVAGAELLQTSVLTDPVGHQLSEERVLQRAVQDDVGETVGLRELQIVVDLVVVARGAGPLDELLGVGTLHQGGQVHPLLHILPVQRAGHGHNSFQTCMRADQ